MCSILHTTDRIIKGVNDMTKAQRYFMEIKDKRVAFIGTGVSHLELIKLFLSMRSFPQRAVSSHWASIILISSLIAI